MPLTNFTYGIRGAAPVAVTASTVTCTANAHANRLINLNRAAGIAVTLPAATGTGDIYTFILSTAVTSNSTTVKVANASDTMTGQGILLADAGDTMVGFQTAATDDTVTFNGTTTGGLKGARVVCMDLDTNLWHVFVISDASGTEATPFSATV